MFIRSARRPFGTRMSLAMVRALFIALYVGYPAGCLLQLWPDDSPLAMPAAIAGLLLIAVSTLAFAILAGSSLQRQAQEPASKLDERELAQRNSAAFHAHSTLAGLVALGFFYIEIALDLSSSRQIELWTPTTSDHWNALMWGAILLGLTLPAAFLAFSRDADASDETD
jgi:hypothetical protein